MSTCLESLQNQGFANLGRQVLSRVAKPLRWAGSPLEASDVQFLIAKIDENQLLKHPLISTLSKSKNVSL
ncbi:hypothetical protein [Nostoc sp.]|uniref:hypothetical protein n=1 Tax=Nostoc sp. TaxID=1180 RepID=UPI002FF6663B